MTADFDITELIKSYVALIVMAVLPIWIGSHSSMKQKEKEKMSQKDALMFPVIGSCALFSLYVAFKYLPREVVNRLLQYYFLLFGAISMGETVAPFFKAILPYSLVKKGNKPIIHVKFWLPNFIVEGGVNIKLHTTDICGLIVGFIIAGTYMYTKHWTTNNIMGLSFCITGIQLMSLETFTTGAMLLLGLFFYDIFWVFATDVMVTVATNFDAPIKLIWPRGDRYSILGLGDIVIPGFFISLMLHFDKYRQQVNKSKTNDKMYFLTCFVFYILGLIVTVAVLTIFKHGQPALLYLVPACLGSVLVLAGIRGELKLLLNFQTSMMKENKNE